MVAAWTIAALVSSDAAACTRISTVNQWGRHVEAGLPQMVSPVLYGVRADASSRDLTLRAEGSEASTPIRVDWLTTYEGGRIAMAHPSEPLEPAKSYVLSDGSREASFATRPLELRIDASGTQAAPPTSPVVEEVDTGFRWEMTNSSCHNNYATVVVRVGRWTSVGGFVEVLAEAPDGTQFSAISPSRRIEVAAQEIGVYGSERGLLKWDELTLRVRGWDWAYGATAWSDPVVVPLAAKRQASLAPLRAEQARLRTLRETAKRNEDDHEGGPGQGCSSCVAAAPAVLGFSFPLSGMVLTRRRDARAPAIGAGPTRGVLASLLKRAWRQFVERAADRRSQ